MDGSISAALTRKTKDEDIGLTWTIGRSISTPRSPLDNSHPWEMVRDVRLTELPSPDSNISDGKIQI